MVLTYSTTKGATAVCANRLAEQGLLDVDAPVVEGTRRSSPGPARRRSRSAICWRTRGTGHGSTEPCRSTRPSPGTRSSRRWPGSHPRGSPGPATATMPSPSVTWWVRSCAASPGGALGTYFRDEITGPLDADWYVGLPTAEEHRVARLEPGPEGNPFETLASLGTGSASDPAVEELLTQLAPYLGPDGTLTKALAGAGRGVLVAGGLGGSAPVRRGDPLGQRHLRRPLARPRLRRLRQRRGPSRRRSLPGARPRPAGQGARGSRRSDPTGCSSAWTSRGDGLHGEHGPHRPGRTRQGPAPSVTSAWVGRWGWADPDLELGLGYVMNRMSLGVTGDGRSADLIHATLSARGRRGLTPPASAASCSGDGRRDGVGTDGQIRVPAADHAGVLEGRPGELQRRRPRVGGRADVVPVQEVLPQARVPARGWRREGRSPETGRGRVGIRVERRLG